jgi:hypothetical protein
MTHLTNRIAHDDRRIDVQSDARGLRAVRASLAVIMLFGLFIAAGCEASTTSTTTPSPAVTNADGLASKKQEESHMWMTVGERRFAITLSDNAAARELGARLPLSVEMSELNGNEKHAELAKALPADASRPGTIRNGDLMLYGTTTLVVFYSTFDSSYSYTRLGRVDDPTGLAEALGSRGVRVVFSKS